MRRDTGQVIFARSGDNTETLKPVVVDLLPHIGKEIFIRLVDESSGGWGHLNFDDFRCTPGGPSFPTRRNSPSPTSIHSTGIPPEEAAKNMVVPEGFRRARWSPASPT